IEIPRCAFAIHEHGTRAFVDDGIRGGREGEGRADDVVPLLHAKKFQAEMDGGRAARQGDAWKPSARLRKFLLEGGQMRADRREPIRRESFADESLLERSHVGLRQVDPAHSVAPAERRILPREAWWRKIPYEFISLRGWSVRACCRSGRTVL